MHRIVFVLAALVVACAPAYAQSAVNVRPEQEVRLVAPRSGFDEFTIGTVMEVRADTLVVQVMGRDTVRDALVPAQHAIPISHLAVLEVHAGSGNRRTGVMYGALTGTGVGIAAAVFHRRFSDRDFQESCVDTPNGEECAVFPGAPYEPYENWKSAAIIGAGTVAGIAVGVLKPGRAWRNVLPAAVDALGAAPAPGGGVRVEGRIRF